MAPLPPAYQDAQQIAYRRLQGYMQILNAAAEQGQSKEVEKPAPGVREKLDERTAQVWAF